MISVLFEFGRTKKKIGSCFLAVLKELSAEHKALFLGLLFAVVSMKRTIVYWSYRHESSFTRFYAGPSISKIQHIIFNPHNTKHGSAKKSTWAYLLESWLALTSVKYHDNLLILMLLNQWLALTMLRTTGPCFLS